MKKKVTKEVCKTGLLLVALFLFPLIARSQEKDYREVYEKSFSGIQILEVDHRRGDIEVLPSSANQVAYQIELTFKAQEEDAAQELIRHFDINTDQSGSALSLSTELNISKWNSRNGNVRIQFKDGVKISGIKEVSVKMKLYVPTLDQLTLSNKYDGIIIEQAVNAALKINLYSGRLKIGQTRNDLTLALKYGKAQIGDFKNAAIDIYDGTLKLGNGGKVTLTSKYSEIEMGNISSLKAAIYDDELIVQDIQGELVLQDKYSDIKINRAQNARLDIYDGDFQLDRVNDLQIKSKYTNFRLGSVGSLAFELSYDDEIMIKEVEELSSSESKYSDYNILTLLKSLKMSSYDDNIEIGSVGKTFSGLTFDGKYTDLSIKLDPSIAFRIDSYKKYGKLRFPQDRFEARIYKEKNDELELQGSSKGAASDSPLLKINAHDCNISIQ